MTWLVGTTGGEGKRQLLLTKKSDGGPCPYLSLLWRRSPALSNMPCENIYPGWGRPGIPGFMRWHNTMTSGAKGCRV